MLEKLLYLLKMLRAVRCDGPEREGECVRMAGQFAHARGLHCCSPCDCASENALCSENLSNLHLRESVLECHEHSIFCQIVFEHSHDFSIVLLLCH